MLDRGATLGAGTGTRTYDCSSSSCYNERMLNRPILWSARLRYFAFGLLAVALLALPACDLTGGANSTPTSSSAPAITASPSAGQPTQQASATQTTQATGDDKINADKLFHDSRDTQYRN